MAVDKNGKEINIPIYIMFALVIFGIVTIHWYGEKLNPTQEQLVEVISPQEFLVEFVDKSDWENGYQGYSKQGDLLIGMVRVKEVNGTVSIYRYINKENKEYKFDNPEDANITIKFDGYLPVKYSFTDKSNIIELYRAKDWNNFYKYVNPLDEIEEGVIYIGEGEYRGTVLLKTQGEMYIDQEYINIKGNIYKMIGMGYAEQLILRLPPN